MGIRSVLLLLCILLVAACGPKETHRIYSDKTWTKETFRSCYKWGYCYYMGKFQSSHFCPGREKGTATYQEVTIYYEDDTEVARGVRIDFEVTGTCQ